MFSCVLLAGALFISTETEAVRLDQVTHLELDRQVIRSQLLIHTGAGAAPIPITLSKEDARRNPADLLGDCVTAAMQHPPG